MRGPGGGGTATEGFCWVDVLLAMALAVLMAALAVPLTARSLDALRARDAAGFICTRIRVARQQAISSSAGVAVVFDQTAAGWTFRLCQDRNRNGVRRAEIDAGRDECPSGPWRLSDQFPGLSVGRDASVPGFDAEPGTSDALALGRADMVSCSTTGGCTTGTVFLQSTSGDQYAVRISGVAGRTRVLRFDRGAGRWVAA
jgi:hypothetical protein